MMKNKRLLLIALLQPITLTHFRLPCTFCMTRTEVLPDLFSFFSTNMPQR